MYVYPKIKNLTREDMDKFYGRLVYIFEKVDGSQIKFGRVAGKFFIETKGRLLYEDGQRAHYGGFGLAVSYLTSMYKMYPDKFPNDTVFIGEYLSKPKHGKLAYDKVPKNNIILHDVWQFFNGDIDNGWFLPLNNIRHTASQLGLEGPHRLYYTEMPAHQATIDTMLKSLSRFGKKIEGFVIKCVEYNGQQTMFKCVSPEFREVKQIKERKATDLDALIDRYKTEARWDKAIQHLRDAGELSGDVSDISELVIEIQKDLGQEEKESIKDGLWKLFYRQIMVGVVQGFAEYYRNQLLK